MRQPLGDADDVVISDAELLARVRGGDTARYAELVTRHAPAALRLAAQVAGEADPDVLVGEAFDRVLEVLRAGGGPDIALRPYLLTVVRRLRTTEDAAPFEPGAAFADHGAGSALASLPERWQLVLWHLAVEGESPNEVARLLGVPTDSIPALADQARNGLDQAFGDREDELGSDIRALLGPVVLGACAVAYLGPLPAPVATVASRGDGQSVVSRFRAAVPGRAGGAMTATAVGGVLAIAAVVTVVVRGPDPREPQPGGTADGPRGERTSRSAPRDILTHPVASATGVPTSARTRTSARPPAPAPTTAVTLAGTGTSHHRPAGHASTRPAAAPSSRSHQKPSPNPATADVAVTARSTTTVPHSYDVDSTLSGVPAGRTTSLVVQGSQGMTLSSNDMSCTGGGSSRLSCTVGSGTTRASFSVVNLGVGAGQVTLTIAPVEGFADPAHGNNATTLTLD